MNIKRKVLQCVFDIAVESMDFGSGFLDRDEIEALRAVAVLLGVDPLVATPDNHKCQYLGHKWYKAHSHREDWFCRLCFRRVDTRPEGVTDEEEARQDAEHAAYEAARKHQSMDFGSGFPAEAILDFPPPSLHRKVKGFEPPVRKTTR